MVLNSAYLGYNRGWLWGLGRGVSFGAERLHNSAKLCRKSPRDTIPKPGSNPKTPLLRNIP